MKTATATKRNRHKHNGAVWYICTKCSARVSQQATDCWSCGSSLVSRDAAQRRDAETDLAYARRTLARHQANATRTENAIRRWTLRVRTLEAAERRKGQPTHGHEIRRRGIALKGE